MVLSLVVLAALSGSTAAAGCTSEDECYMTKNWRCVEAPAGQGSPCTLDYGYNTTGTCACSDAGSHAVCVPGVYPSATKGRKQYLVIGDSVSMGYFSALKANLSDWDVVHAPGNNDNTNWGRRCLKGWLGPDPDRWDFVSMNWGLHDLAFPDNEHLAVGTYATLLGDIVAQLKTLAPRAKRMWVATTPVPTAPPDDPISGKSCVLIPGRIETDVLKYNVVAANVTAGTVGSVCDLHTEITDYCGVGYKSCTITQCAGPHFSHAGFAMLGNKMAGCAKAAF